MYGWEEGKEVVWEVFLHHIGKIEGVYSPYRKTTRRCVVLASMDIYPIPVPPLSSCTICTPILCPPSFQLHLAIRDTPQWMVDLCVFVSISLTAKRRKKYPCGVDRALGGILYEQTDTLHLPEQNVLVLSLLHLSRV